jgi:SagB-type dehydrogenase family enzyme
VPNDLSRHPPFFKRYDDSLPRVVLPRELPRTAHSAVEVLAGTAGVAPRELDLEHLSRLLHLSAGVVRTAEGRYGTFLFRAAGSAGGRFPLELYVAIPDGLRLPAGVHWYHPREHALVRLAAAPRGESPVLVVTGVPWRTGWRYRERGFRHVYWDAGTMLSQLLAAADSAGIAAHLYTRFPDHELAPLVGADGVQEWPVALIVLGGGAPALDATEAAATGVVADEPVEFPLVTAAQRAGERSALGSAWGRGRPVEVSAEAKPMEDVILARSSQRLFDRMGMLAGDVFEMSLRVGLRVATLPHRVAVNAVEGYVPGLYRWPDLRRAVREGDLRRELYFLSAEQGLPRDAAFVVVAAADVGALDDGEYRDAHLGAGLVEGRLHLLAYAFGAGASGMTFYDSEVPQFLGEPLDGLLLTCVGVPGYTARRGGGPGAPTPIREVRTRVDDEAV